MKIETVTQYITEDKKVFFNEKDALKWEESLSKDINAHVIALDKYGKRTYDVDDADFIYVDNDAVIEKIGEVTCILGMSHKGAWVWDTDTGEWVFATYTLDCLREKLAKYDMLYHNFKEMTK